MDSMLKEGNSNINRICSQDHSENSKVNANCIYNSPVVVDAQYQMLKLDSNNPSDKSSIKVSSHFHSIGSKSDKFPVIDVKTVHIETVADNYYG